MDKTIKNDMSDIIEIVKVITASVLGITAAQISQTIQTYSLWLELLKDLGSVVLVFWSIYYVANKGLRVNQSRRFEKEDRDNVG